ncbi:MAG: VF530 family protein [Methylococcales bacterium]
MTKQPNNPLHGITLETMLTELVEEFGWQQMGKTIAIRCFINEPSIKSSLKFLRKTPWARQQLEAWYLSIKN